MMDINEQERTFDGFMKAMVRGTAAVVVLMIFLAAFVA
ncbi:aa3-type cytochrome c oxidase subunit IV [Kordiimonas lipolytica]|uniref:Aa3-type cytochrome c oxidase subunit IV n=1 Tax=Kordiimonas lipolytica TaxID=1662421 RepID=A0ABV8UFC4_9PROT|nr:aa3-type cytochrome c oxidase subunit IV [Kordiimonas lipolytica]